MEKDEIAFDKRIKQAKTLFDENLIKDFKDIFEIVSYSKLAKILGIHNYRMRAKIEDPMKFHLGEVKSMATILDVDFLSLVSLMDRSAANVAPKPDLEK